MVSGTMATAMGKGLLSTGRGMVSKAFCRSLNTGSKASSKTKTLTAFTASGLATIGAVVYISKTNSSNDNASLSRCVPSVLHKFLTNRSSVVADFSRPLLGVVSAKERKGSQYLPCKCRKNKSKCEEPQQNVITPTMKHSLFLWISLKSCSDKCAVARAASDINALLCSVGEPCNPNQEGIIAGVGFGPSFYSQVKGKTKKSFYYGCRKCVAGELPHQDGDIFLHVKSNDRGKLFEICKNFLSRLPEDSVDSFEDIYGYSYNCNRDLSGLCLNTSNRPTEEGKKEVAVECETGGSYALAMKWVHDLEVIRPNNDEALEKLIGRDFAGFELESKTETCHVSRMRGSSEYNTAPCHEAVMQKHSYGTLSDDAGLFVLGFANDPLHFEFMLDQMVGSCADGCFDDVFKFSENVKGTYFYFPGLKELECLKTSGLQ